MKLVSFSTAGGVIRPGSLLEEPNLVIDLATAGYADALAVITDGFTAGPTALAPGSAYPAYPLSQVQLHAPLLNPPRVFAIGLNYRDHAKESGMAIPTTPVVFFKLPTAIVGPGAPLVLPINSSQPDYEAEFAFVIGKGGYRIPASAWRDHVYGYTIVNDVSARDVQFASTQWSLSKSFPTFCPLGPAIVTADEIPDPHTLAIGHQRADLQNPRTDRISLFDNSPSPRRHSLHRHTLRRRPWPHPQTLAPPRRNRHGHRRRSGLPDQPRSSRMKKRNPAAGTKSHP